MIVETASGSMYQIAGLKARRLSGPNDPTPRLGYDGAWRALQVEPVVRIGLPIVLIWTDEIDPPAAEGHTPGTVTSRVVRIEGMS